MNISEMFSLVELNSLVNIVFAANKNSFFEVENPIGETTTLKENPVVFC